MTILIKESVMKFLLSRYSTLDSILDFFTNHVISFDYITIPNSFELETPLKIILVDIFQLLY